MGGTETETEQGDTMQFSTYTPHERGDGDNFKPSEHMDTPLIVKVNEHKAGIVTVHKPQGGDGIIIDVCEINTGTVATDALWMGGALVDGLKPYVGQTLVIRLTWAKSKAGKDYATISPATAADMTAAEKYVTANGDPFAPTLATVPAATKRDDSVPF